MSSFGLERPFAEQEGGRIEHVAIQKSLAPRILQAWMHRRVGQTREHRGLAEVSVRWTGQAHHREVATEDQLRADLPDKGYIFLLL